MWAPVALAAVGSGEYIARVTTTTTAGDPTVIGVTVGGLKDAQNLYCSDAAGQAVQVCTFGQAKVKVNGNTDNIAVGDALVSTNAAGIAVMAAIDPGSSYVQAERVAEVKEGNAQFAMALYASVADGDIISAHVYGARGTAT